MCLSSFPQADIQAKQNPIRLAGQIFASWERVLQDSEYPRQPNDFRQTAAFYRENFSLVIGLTFLVRLSHHFFTLCK